MHRSLAYTLHYDTYTHWSAKADLILYHHDMYLCVCFTGKYAVSHILSKSDNVTAILPFVEPRKQREHDEKLSKSSVSSRYAAVLLLQILQSEKGVVQYMYMYIYNCYPLVLVLGSVRGDFLAVYSSRLLSMAEFFKGMCSLSMAFLKV